ncbi:MAG: DUF2065 domain-containing protein [Gammaproteobacteria bacterium]|nr:DUF2065 domain-containing protein [Gammaproteobacteria bacterium]
MWHDLLTAIALLLVLEGIMPFINPEALRKALMMAVGLNDATLRFIGLTSMLIGVLMLYYLR